MSTRHNLIMALGGNTPKVTPLTFYSWMVTGDKPENLPLLMQDEWKRLYDKGLGICHHVRVIKEIQHDVKETTEVFQDGTSLVTVHKKTTPVGTIRQVHKDGWHTEYWIKTPQDYKVMTWIMENTELVTDYEAFEAAEEFIGDYGLSVILGSRTPAMMINVDWAGTELFCMDVACQNEELLELYEVRKKLFIQETGLIAKGPGRFVKWLENLTISMLGPHRYGELLVPIYRQCVPILEAAGKRVMVHYDGALSVIKDQIAHTPFHIIESLTESPEGDMTYAECRLAWPDKVFWANINVDLYYKPDPVLRQAVIDKHNRAGKKGLAFEISEDMPSNYKDSIPVVLKTLKELR